MKRITRGRITAESLVKRVTSAKAGAVVSFIGTVRGSSDGRRVLRLEYEAHERMADRALRGIEEEAKRRYVVTDAAIVHRVGRVAAGEASVGVAVSAPHRVEAFKACRFCIDRIKAVAPIWKKEVYPDGEKWIRGGTARGRARRGRTGTA